jgi:peroxiredoxin Q/BCP
MTLQVGDHAPDFTMPTVSGGNVSLNDLRGKKVVLYFYPKDDTPGCTIEACSFRDNLPSFEGVNAEVIGVSRDNTESHQRFRDKYGLNFTLASDDSGQVTEDYGVWREKNMYGKTFMGIQRSTFLIDENGNIAKIWPSVSVDGHTQEVLAALNGQDAPAAASEAPMPAAKPKAARKPKAAAAKPVRKATAKKATAKKATAKKATAKKAPAKKAAAKKTTAKKAGRKVAAKAAKKPARKAAKATKKPARKAAAKKATGRKAASKTARKTTKKTAKKPAKRATARAGARRTAARRPARRTTAARRR